MIEIFIPILVICMNGTCEFMQPDTYYTQEFQCRDSLEKQKEVEVKTAEAESRRMSALANNSGASIAFMQAQAMLNISEGIKNGQVQTIVVPSNFNALMMPK